MPALFILTVLIQLGLIVHVLKTGRNTTWVFILLFAPMIGGLAYLIVELLPEWTNSRGARQARRGLSRVIDPNRDMRQASDNLAVADTVQNAMRLAGEYMRQEKFAEAKELYQRALRGIHADDPALLLGLAQAQFGLGDYSAVVATLDELKEKNPTHTSAEGHLLYARALEESGRTAEAIEEYESLCNYFPGPEPTCRLAKLLQAQGKTERARELFNRVLAESRTAGRHYNSLHRDWVATAREGVK
jgi:hypothetical protein